MLLSEGEPFRVVRGDCIQEMPNLPAGSMDLLVTSVPFPALYAYTSLPGDVGNSEDLKAETRLHLSFFYRQLPRVLRPGRVAVVHVTQIQRMKRSGGSGAMDFRGLNIRLGERAGLVYEYDWAVRKNPQAQAIRTKSRALQFAGLESDRAQSRGAVPDYLIKFRAPGDNAVPVRGTGQVSRNEWIDWAECCWSGLSESDTLNVNGTKGEGDTKHICPLQLGVIDRLVRLYTNPGEVVFDPFAGIGSTGFQAILRGRRFFGFELKGEYAGAARGNLARALRRHRSESRTLFDGLTSEASGNDLAR